jgi:hypothetical protein
MKKSIILGAIILVAIIIFFIAKNQFSTIYVSDNEQFFFDERNSTFQIDRNTITLTNGKSTTDSKSGATYRYFGNNASGDLNGDKIPDIAFLVTGETSGSGLFYYAVIAIQENSGYRSIGTAYLGDRIAPQTTEIKSGRLTVNYADRKPNEPFTSQPSVGRSARFIVSNNKLIPLNK